MLAKKQFLDKKRSNKSMHMQSQAAEEAQHRQFQLRRIQMEDKLFSERKKSQAEIKNQVKIMKDQLAMKKKQMMQELRELKQDYKSQQNRLTKRNSVAVTQPYTQGNRGML